MVILLLLLFFIIIRSIKENPIIGQEALKAYSILFILVAVSSLDSSYVKLERFHLHSSPTTACLPRGFHDLTYTSKCTVFFGG